MRDDLAKYGVLIGLLVCIILWPARMFMTMVSVFLGVLVYKEITGDERLMKQIETTAEKLVNDRREETVVEAETL